MWILGKSSQKRWFVKGEVQNARLFTEISTSKELSNPMKFPSKAAQNSRSGSGHLGVILAAWWWVRDMNALNLRLAERLNHSTLLFCLFWIVFIVIMISCQLQNKETRSFEWLNKLRLSSLMSHTRHQATKSSPIWRPPDLEVWASLDKNFKGVESSLEVEILVSNLPLYNLFVGKKKKCCHFGMNFCPNILDRKECFLDHKSEIVKNTKKSKFSKWFLSKNKNFCVVCYFWQIKPENCLNFILLLWVVITPSVTSEFTGC